MASGLLTGCVKWFNHNLNYGFVTVLTDGEHHNVDIFVHQSNIKTKNDCYRTLSPGECVQFEIAKSDNTSHPIHAVNITGFNGGMLNCESARPRNFNSGGRGDGGSGGRGGGGGRGRGGRSNDFNRDGNRDSNRDGISNHEVNTRSFVNENNRGYNRNFNRQPYVSHNTEQTVSTEHLHNQSTVKPSEVQNNNNNDSDIIDSVVIVSSDTKIENSTSTSTTSTSKPRGRGRGRGSKSTVSPN